MSGHSPGRGQGKPERYMQPSLLMALLDGPSYGYELAGRIADYGFIRGDAPPGMVYRHLRQMEEEGLVVSRWDAEGEGPAKRVYSLTDEGLDVLDAWVDHMRRQARRLQEFAASYQERMDGRRAGGGKAKGS